MTDKYVQQINASFYSGRFVGVSKIRHFRSEPSDALKTDKILLHADNRSGFHSFFNCITLQTRTLLYEAILKQVNQLLC